MKVIGLVGWSGSGKTTLMVQLVVELVRRGYKVSTMKHAHHGFDLDQPGKDSHRHREAGATEVLITSARRWAVMHELRDEAEPGLAELVPRLTPVDLLIVEGFKSESYDKIEIWREEVGKPMRAPDDARVVALATDAPLARPLGIPVLDLNRPAAIADFVVRHCGLPARVPA